jgi:hypothetical protein
LRVESPPFLPEVLKTIMNRPTKDTIEPFFSPLFYSRSYPIWGSLHGLEVSKNKKNKNCHQGIRKILNGDPRLSLNTPGRRNGLGNIIVIWPVSSTFSSSPEISFLNLTKTGLLFLSYQIAFGRQGRSPR